MVWTVRKMEKNRIPRMNMIYKQTYKKQRGVPKKAWFDGIKEAMEK